MKTSTVALVTTYQANALNLVEILCDEGEITCFEGALQSGEVDPLGQIYQQREQQSQQESDFGDYIEELLSQPFLNPEVQRHGVQWFLSKIRIDEFRKSEQEAAQVIAEYAFKIFQTDSSRTDFFLASGMSQVRVRIFTLSTVPARKVPFKQAA